MGDTKNIIVMDDHPLSEAAIQACMRGADVKLQTRSVDNLAELRVLLEAKSCDLFVMSMQGSGSDGLRRLAEIRLGYPELPVLLLDAEATQDKVEQARLIGARGVLAARSTMADVRDCLAALLNGSDSFPAGIPQVGAAPGPSSIAHLSPAQKRVLSELALGKANREIAETLCLSEATIKSHLYAIYKELGVKNRTQALLKIQ